VPLRSIKRLKRADNLKYPRKRIILFPRIMEIGDLKISINLIETE